MNPSAAFLRNAEWLFARALKLREQGDAEGAEIFELRAVQYLDQAIQHHQQERQGR
jgi:hypothetical protein